MGDNKAKAFRRGNITFLALLLLTALEFLIGIGVILNGSLTVLFLVALIKAALIVYVFMHIYRLWREESHE